MRKIAMAFAFAMLLQLDRPTVAQAISGEATPPAALTLSEALAAAAVVIGNSSTISVLERQNSITSLAAPSSTFGVSSVLGQAPQGGSPAQSTYTEELTLDIGSRDSRLGALRTSQASTAQALATAAIARRNAAQGVLTAFFAVAGDQAQLSAATTSADLANRSLSAATQRHRLGVAPLVDVQRAQAALATVRAEVASANAALVGDRSILSALIDRPSLPLVVLPPASPIPDQQAASIIASRTNPSVVSATASLEVAQASLLTAEGQLHSAVVIGAGLQVVRQGPATSVGPALSVGLASPLNSNLGRATLAAARAITVAAQTTLTQAQRDALQTALISRTQALSLATRVPLLISALDAAQSVAAAELAGYRLGAVTSSDLIIAQTQLATARAALATAQVQAAQAAATLQLQIGALDR